ncbi:MAG TPA: hypothetical protein VMW91_10545, partial [Desulfosporosinus sp.]|nr:hypothetical protein [Desulfosporosinus sp.]
MALDKQVLERLRSGFQSRTQLVDSRNIKNILPPDIRPLTDDAEQQNDTGPTIGNLTSLVDTLTGGTSGTIPGQLPGTDFNMGAVDTTSLGQRTAQTTSKEFDADKFARMAGAFGAAIAPSNSWQSRLGAAASGLAAENLKGRAEQEQARLEAPGKALEMEKTRLGMKKTQAEIDKLKREDKEKRFIPISAGGLYDTQTGQIISPSEKSSDKATVQEVRKDEDGNYVMGWLEKGGTGFTPVRPATQGERKKAEGKGDGTRLEYENDSAKLVDDTRSFYHEKVRHMLD